MALFRELFERPSLFPAETNILMFEMVSDILDLPVYSIQ